MQPNTIIAALLDIASAAFNYTHAAKGEPASEAKQVLRERVDTLDPLVGQFIRSQKNPPECAREILQSFLEGEGDVIDLIEKRTRAFPPMTLRIDMTPEQEAEMKRVFEQYASKPLQAGEFIEGVNAQTIPVSALTGAVDVQRDGIQFEFEPQEWKAPATGPGFTPTAEFPTSGPIHHDFYTHRDAWRALIGRALIARSEKAEGDDGSYGEHELRAFDRAFDSLPPQHERRLRERMIEPAIPVVGKEALVDATRPLFVKAMQSQGHRADLDERGLYKGVSEYRWEGWRAAVESMGFKVSPSEALTNMLADTADEALRIINDAGLLKNLVELFTMRDPGTTVKIYQSSRENAATPWCLNVHEEGKVARHYRSTSPHQVIAVAHKGEQDHEYPEPEMCAYCGMSFETPCDAPPTGPCEQANNAFHGSDPTKPRPPAFDLSMSMPMTIRSPASVVGISTQPAPSDRRNEMNALLVRVKDELGVPVAKEIIKNVGESSIMANIATAKVEAVITACEERLKRK